MTRIRMPAGTEKSCIVLLLLVCKVVFLNGECQDCSGCELLMQPVPESMDDYAFPSVNVTAIANTRLQESIKDAFTKFVSLALTVTELMPESGPAIRFGYGVFTGALALVTKGSGRGTWAQVEEKVNDRITAALTASHFQALRPFWERINEYYQYCPERLTVDCMSYLIRRKTTVFPQNNQGIDFTPMWVSHLTAWLMNVAGLYMELIRQQKLWSCSVYEEFKVLRGDVIDALKSLHYKRYRSIKGGGWGKPSNSAYSFVRFQDKQTSSWYPSDDKKNKENNVILPYTKRDIFPMIRDETITMIEPIRQRFNDLLSTMEEMLKLCGEPIEDIPESASSIDWPATCWGASYAKIGSEGPCTLPCDTYSTDDSDDYWCPNENALHMSGRGKPGKFSGVQNWASCEPDRSPSFMTCAPVALVDRSEYGKNIQRWRNLLDEEKLSGKAKKAKKAKKGKGEKEE